MKVKRHSWGSFLYFIALYFGAFGVLWWAFGWKQGWAIWFAIWLMNWAHNVEKH